MASTIKKPSRKVTNKTLWSGDKWCVKWGKLGRMPGHPGSAKSLFSWVGEKIPFDALKSVRQLVWNEEENLNGVYIAHDSMGFARYVGRGHVFDRLLARKRAYPDELVYFSFYLIEEKKHEREIETLLIRLGGAHLHFNDKKKRVDTSPGKHPRLRSGHPLHRTPAQKG